ncbi:MAG: caspase family protein, partial [Afipia sp.]
MTRHRIRTLLTGLVALTVLFAAPAYAEKRVALVIGNNDYRNVPRLQKAVNDARTMSDALKQLGFNVLFAENQTRQAFSETMLAFDKIVQPGDTAFFFFAGHGFEINGQNYLLPTDIAAVTQGQEELIRDGAFAAERVISRLQARGARTSIFVFDACRNNPFEATGTRALGGSGGLAPISPPEGVFVIFSAGAKQTALDRLNDNDPNPNSVFTRSFVRELAQPGLNLVQIAKRTQSDVRQMTAAASRMQTPAYYDQIVGDYVLRPAKEGERAIAIEPQVAALPVQPAPPIVIDNGNAPIASFMRHNGGWSIAFSIADPTLAISWRLGESGEFKETGFTDALDPRTRRRMPNPSIELPNDAPAATIQV